MADRSGQSLDTQGTTMKTKFNTTLPVLPNFLIAGAAKCGTTSLYYYLQQHPDIFMSPVKEPNFLSCLTQIKYKHARDQLSASRDVRTYDAYCRLFEKSGGRKAVGEASLSTMYLYDRSIPAIKRYLGDPQIIMILRDPVARAYSAYTFIVRDGWETLSFAESLKMEEKRKADGCRLMWLYRGLSLYAHQVRAFQENFSQVQVLLYDDLKRSAPDIMRSVFTFLDVNPDFVPATEQIQNASGIPRWKLFNDLLVKPKLLHKSARTFGGAVLGVERWASLRERLRSANLRKAPAMDPSIERKLRQFFRKDILKLQDYINRDLTAWLGGRPA